MQLFPRAADRRIRFQVPGETWKKLWPDPRHGCLSWGAGLMASALVIVLGVHSVSAEYLHRDRPQGFFFPLPLPFCLAGAFGGGGGKSLANGSRQRSCVDQAAPSPASCDLSICPCIPQPQWWQWMSNKGPISASSGRIALVIRPVLLRLYWRGMRPRNEHTFIMRGKFESAAIVTNTTPWATCCRRHGGTSPSNGTLGG
jgi:hypothetical protein